MGTATYWKHPVRSIRRALLLCLFSVVVWGFIQPGNCAERFAPQSFVLQGKILSVIPADLDEKGPAEIIVVSKTGIYPSEKRWISVFSADDIFRYGSSPRQRWEVDRDAAIFEVGDVAPFPGKEIFFITSSGIRYYARQERNRFATQSLTLLKVPTAAVASAAGSLPRSGLLADWHKDGRKMLMIPQFGVFKFFNLNASGNWNRAEQVSIVPRTFLQSDREDDGILRSYSFRLDYRFPRFATRDFNGDGRQDLLLTKEESIYVYLQNAGGHFSREPVPPIHLPGRPRGKQPDWNFSLQTIPADINNDGFADMVLLFSHGTGSFLERKVDVSIFLNQKVADKPFLDHPHQTLTFKGITPGVCLTDLNGDGFQDLMFSYIRLGFWNTVKNLISKKVAIHTSVYLLQRNQIFSSEPDFHTETEYKLDLTHGIKFNGIWPSVEGDFNGDGSPDLLIANDGELRIYRTPEGKGMYSKLYHQANIRTCRFAHIADLNRDGLDDILLYEKKKDGSISVLLNKGL
jgi:hypothetical protein